MAFSGDFYPLSHKHTRNLELSDAISIAVDRIYRGFEPLKEQIRTMKEQALSEEVVKLIIYQAFLDKGVKGIPRHLMPVIHGLYFNPEHEAFLPRNLWSLSNAFTSAMKKLTPIKQFEVTARLGDYLTHIQDELQEKQKLEFELQRNGKLIPISQVGRAERNNLRDEYFDEDDIAEDLQFENEFDEYFDEEEAFETIDETVDEMMEEYERRAA